MGYCMSQGDTVFKIVLSNQAAALRAMKAHAADGSAGRFSWVDDDEVKSASSLRDALKAWHWNVGKDDGDISEIYFDGEKLGDDQELFKVIAPFVEAGSFIEMWGEDNAIWRWNFDGAICVESYGRVTFEDGNGPALDLDNVIVAAVLDPQEDADNGIVIRKIDLGRGPVVSDDVVSSMMLEIADIVPKLRPQQIVALHGAALEFARSNEKKG